MYQVGMVPSKYYGVFGTQDASAFTSLTLFALGIVSAVAIVCGWWAWLFLFCLGFFSSPFPSANAYGQWAWLCSFPRLAVSSLFSSPHRICVVCDSFLSFPRHLCFPFRCTAVSFCANLLRAEAFVPRGAIVDLAHNTDGALHRVGRWCSHPITCSRTAAHAHNDVISHRSRHSRSGLAAVSG